MSNFGRRPPPESLVHDRTTARAPDAGGSRERPTLSFRAVQLPSEVGPGSDRRAPNSDPRMSLASFGARISTMPEVVGVATVGPDGEPVSINGVIEPELVDKLGFFARLGAQIGAQLGLEGARETWLTTQAAKLLHLRLDDGQTVCAVATPRCSLPQLTRTIHRG
jgi:hypothetical protein